MLTSVCVWAPLFVDFARPVVDTVARADLGSGGFAVATLGVVDGIGSRFRFVTRLHSKVAAVWVAFVVEDTGGVEDSDDDNNSCISMGSASPPSSGPLNFVGDSKLVLPASSLLASVARSSCPNDLWAKVTVGTLDVGPDTIGSLYAMQMRLRR